MSYLLLCGNRGQVTWSSYRAFAFLEEGTVKLNWQQPSNKGKTGKVPKQEIANGISAHPPNTTESRAPTLWFVHHKTKWKVGHPAEYLWTAMVYSSIKLQSRDIQTQCLCRERNRAMKRSMLFILAFLILVVPLLRAKERSGSKGDCIAIQHALRDVANLKVGSSRREVEKAFARAGGINFRNQTRYVYPECEFIGIEVEFDADKAVNNDFSPSDTATKISRPYLEFPSRD
jgi:hypothetical protein